jgi:nicotinate phosphoribosyltransferase
LIETALLNIVNYQTLIATKARRIKAVIEDEPLMEFGTRRAQEMDLAIWGTQAKPLLVEHLRLPMFEQEKSLAYL